MHNRTFKIPDMEANKKSYISCIEFWVGGCALIPNLIIQIKIVYNNTNVILRVKHQEFWINADNLWAMSIILTIWRKATAINPY